MALIGFEKYVTGRCVVRVPAVERHAEHVDEVVEAE